MDTLILFSGIPRNFFRGGGGLRQEFFGGCSTNSVEDRENGDLGVVAQSVVPLDLQMNETRILIRLLSVYIPRNWEFGSALSKFRNFRGGFKTPQTPTPPLCMPMILFNFA
jgi:hypothetical protein